MGLRPNPGVPLVMATPDVSVFFFFFFVVVVSLTLRCDQFNGRFVLSRRADLSFCRFSVCLFPSSARCVTTNLLIGCSAACNLQACTASRTFKEPLFLKIMKLISRFPKKKKKKKKKS